MSRPRDKLLYRLVYKKGVITVLPEFMPTCPHLDEPVVAVDVLAEGQIERGGKRLDYQDVRLYLEPKP